LAAGGSVRLSQPDPDEGWLLKDWEHTHSHPSRNLRLRRDVYTFAVGVVRTTVVTADQSIRIDATVRQRKCPMRATVGERGDSSAGTAPQHDLLAEQAPTQRRFRDLVTSGRDVPALPGIVGSHGVHRSSTSLSVRERDTQINIASPAARSASVSTESRWSGVPFSTLASQVPQTPS
jgi:hypothetical protein